MERINSRGGIYYTPHRHRLAPETVKKMSFLYGCYVRENGGLTMRQRVACQIKRDEATDEFTEFLNGLCAWVFYPSDDEAEDDDDEEDDDETSDI